MTAASPQGKVAAVIVTCNRLEKLRTTLANTLALPFAHVVVVDNASTDGTREWLDAHCDPRLRVVREAVNRGGAGGFARGFDEAARRTDADWLVCFDDDAYPEPETLTRFHELEIPPGAVAVAAAVYLPDGRISSMNRPGVSPFHSPALLWRALRRTENRFGIDDDAYTSAALREIDYSSFVGLFVRCSSVRESLGLPRAELFIYADDTLYTLAIRKSGHGLVFAPAVRFVHDCAAVAAPRGVYRPAWRAYYMFRNVLEFYRQLAGPYFHPVMVPLLVVSWLGTLPRQPRPARFLRLACTAIVDGLRRDFSRTHEEVLRLAAD